MMPHAFPVALALVCGAVFAASVGFVAPEKTMNPSPLPPSKASTSFAVVGGTEPRALVLTGDVEFTHDPAIIKQGKTWYVFATGRAPGGGQIAIRTSTDLVHWTHSGHVFDQLPAWVHEISPGTRDLWAPDISFSHGQFRLYYAYSLFGRNTSGIGLATTKTLDSKSPDYKWVDQGLVFKSVSTDDFNAIDPNCVRDRRGREWLSFGSFWGGIKMRELDPSTGKLLASNSTLYSLASRERPPAISPTNPNLPPNWQAVEAPSIVSHGGYYYLFVSWDLCCRGVKSTYRTMVGRSKQVTGPYLDKTGKPMNQGGGSPLLAGNPRWVGPGGETALVQRGSPDLIAFHAYDGTTGRPFLQISTLTWQNDWPEAALADK